GGFWPRSIRLQLRPVSRRGCHLRMRSLFSPVSPPLWPNRWQTPLHSAAWPSGAAATARGPLLAGRAGGKSKTPARALRWGGGEARAADLGAGFDRRHITGRVAIADTFGAAWAAARFTEDNSPVILPPGDCRTALAPLPVEALRLDPSTTQGLRRVG